MSECSVLYEHSCPYLTDNVHVNTSSNANNILCFVEGRFEEVLLVAKGRSLTLQLKQPILALWVIMSSILLSFYITNIIAKRL